VGSSDSGHLLGGDLGCLALAVCALGAAALLVPIGLATIGFAAILGLFSGFGGAPRLDSPEVRRIGAQYGALRTLESRPVEAWRDRPAVNQFDRRNYRSDQSWLTWRDAACSAAALAWLLDAYGQQLGSVDDAIALIGPGTGLSQTLGLLDARGPALAKALAGRGLKPRQPRSPSGQLRPLGSIGELQVWLDHGPLLMDGGRWFSQGHGFVGIGYDAGGVHIRDSSGWDNRYLSWSRLYGEVGFSGWVVGVVS
jgi:hypothetical protein